jgi:hypothetical protein
LSLTMTSMSQSTTGGDWPTLSSYRTTSTSSSFRKTRQPPIGAVMGG